jgi:hypothetical protein
MRVGASVASNEGSGLAGLVGLGGATVGWGAG